MKFCVERNNNKISDDRMSRMSSGVRVRTPHMWTRDTESLAWQVQCLFLLEFDKNKIF